VIIGGLLIAGALGAALRAGVDMVIQRRMGSDFPLGILVVNLSGSLVLGVLVGSAAHNGLSPFWLTIAGTGLLGAYTTFSTFTFDVVSLMENGEWGASAMNTLLSLGAGLGAAAAGLALGSLM